MRVEWVHTNAIKQSRYPYTGIDKNGNIVLFLEKDYGLFFATKQDSGKPFLSKWDESDFSPWSGTLHFLFD